MTHMRRVHIIDQEQIVLTVAISRDDPRPRLLQLTYAPRLGSGRKEMVIPTDQQGVLHAMLKNF